MFICFLTLALKYQITVDQVGCTCGVKHNIFKYFFILAQCLYPDYIIWLHFIFLTFVCKITSIGCFMVIRVWNQTEFRLVIYVNNTLCSRKHRKNNLRTLSHKAHTTPHTISSSGRYGESKITYVHMYYLAFHAKSACLTSHFYSIIGMVRGLPKNRYIFYCVFNKPKLHNFTSKSGQICYTEKLKIAVWDLKLPHIDCYHTK